MNDNIKKLSQGKVRDIFELNTLVIQTTDRVSAFNSVFGGTVPKKGIVLQMISNEWMNILSDIIPNHIITCDPTILTALGFEANRSVIVKKCIMLPVECIVRGYYIPTSSSWNSYKHNNTIQGIVLPPGLRESERLPEPIFTPTTKDENDFPLNLSEMEEHIDDFLWAANYQLTVEDCSFLSCKITETVKETSIKLYQKAYEYALKKGVILADTKLEYGIEINPETLDFSLILCDEAFTPDSSRYWDASIYEVGKTMPSMDKQFFRDYLRTECKWTGLKDGPVPDVPAEVYEKLSKIYKNILYKLFEIDLDRM